MPNTQDARKETNKQKILNTKKCWWYGQVIEHLPRKHKALHSGLVEWLKW
jgi:hypothetical protein